MSRFFRLRSTSFCTVVGVPDTPEGQSNLTALYRAAESANTHAPHSLEIERPDGLEQGPLLGVTEITEQEFEAEIKRLDP